VAGPVTLMGALKAHGAGGPRDGAELGTKRQPTLRARWSSLLFLVFSLFSFPYLRQDGRPVAVVVGHLVGKVQRVGDQVDLLGGRAGGAGDDREGRGAVKGKRGREGVERTRMRTWIGGTSVQVLYSVGGTGSLSAVGTAGVAGRGGARAACGVRSREGLGDGEKTPSRFALSFFRASRPPGQPAPSARAVPQRATMR